MIMLKYKRFLLANFYSFMKKVILLAITVVFAFALGATAFGALSGYFSDESTFATWFAPSARKMKYNGIINGYTDGSFGATKNVNRAELAVMFDKFADAIGKPLQQKSLSCTTNLKPGLVIILKDQKGNAVTKANIFAETLAEAGDEGSFLEDINTPGTYSGISEGDWYYTFKITKAGFADHIETVKLEQDECHVIPQTKTITLISKS